MTVQRIIVGVIVFALYLVIKWSLVRDRPGHFSLPRFLTEVAILAVVVIALLQFGILGDG